MKLIRYHFIRISQNRDLSASGWTSDGLTAIDFSTATFTADTIVFPLYSTPVNNLSLSITNGTVSVAGPYAFNQVVTVTANTAPENYSFSHWTKDGIIVSYNPQYTFTVASNHTLEAVNVLKSGYAAYTDNFVSVSQPYELKEGYETLVGQFALATGETLVEYGFVHSNSETTPTLATANTQVNYSNKYNSGTNEFVMSFNSLSYYYRAFVITIDSNNNVSTKYSTVGINEMVKMRLYTNYGTYPGQDLYLGYLLKENGAEVQAWQEIPATYGVGQTPNGVEYNWYIEISVKPGTVVEWKMIVKEVGKDSIYMPSNNRSTNAGYNQFSSWDNAVNETW